VDDCAERMVFVMMGDKLRTGCVVHELR
jgi:hypothetical protein